MDPEAVKALGGTGSGTIRSVLEGLLRKAEREAVSQGRSEALWSRLGVLLGFGGALGAGIGGVGAIAGDLSGFPQIAVIVLAFAGAGLSAAAGTLRAPEKAELAQTRRKRLEAYSRRVETILAVDLKMAGEIGGIEAQREVLEAALRAYDEIVGVEVPAPVQLTRDPVLLGQLNSVGDKRIASADLPALEPKP